MRKQFPTAFGYQILQDSHTIDHFFSLQHSKTKPYLSYSSSENMPVAYKIVQIAHALRVPRGLVYILYVA